MKIVQYSNGDYYVAQTFKTKNRAKEVKKDFFIPKYNTCYNFIITSYPKELVGKRLRLKIELMEG